ncbi:hypothetical protein MA16_Dca017463 [Dendrobium catenatum]|uniref:Uncharacterized protein n=1 Tax=Dendrobium catenatum TaxID=906689 RepID=A0A2I0WAT6_9ASPA|nr:hypothetical protein MA16_Dca017463 [Dendrobium catenatum]
MQMGKNRGYKLNNSERVEDTPRKGWAQWAEELPNVLWAYRTTARTPTEETHITSVSVQKRSYQLILESRATEAKLLTPMTTRRGSGQI